MRAEASIDIACPLGEVWDYVSDLRNDPAWCAKVKSVEAVGEGRWRVVHKPVPMRSAAVLLVEQVDAQPPTRLALREEDEASVFTVEYTLSPAGGGTRFRQVSEFEWKRLPRALQRLLAVGVRGDLRSQARALKVVLESRTLQR